ncbi:radical SAM protein [Fulvivirga sediminis]|uniref:Radical SAM protein n=1 Tax=Fulvivirga sediminis TaxID=2803949 RepID=A0A937F239_9BACT|nr:radical SAM protein [Fulvivirga sediminis]MBL3654872.1 radical SAM protein [Fulvivirga sediminis]
MRLISHPVLCNYYITYRCNAQCGFCDIWEKPSPYVDIKRVKKNLSDLKRLGVKVIDFTGGEPLLHQNLDLILKEAKSLGFITTVTTNCLLYPKMAKKLKGLIDMLHFSLDSPNEDEHNLSRGVRCFDFLLKSLEVAKDLGEKPDILFTVFENNVDQIEEVYEKFCKPNGLVLILNPMFEYGSVNTGDALSNNTLTKLKYWSKKPSVYLNDAFVQLRIDGGNHINKPVCKAASSTVVISPFNELILPCYHLGIQSIKIQDDLYDLYHSEEVKKLIAQEGRMPACEGCTINCYMQPSFAIEMNKYWWKALPSTLKYNLLKGTWKQLLPGKKA